MYPNSDRRGRMGFKAALLSTLVMASGCASAPKYVVGVASTDAKAHVPQARENAAEAVKGPKIEQLQAPLSAQKQATADAAQNSNPLVSLTQIEALVPDEEIEATLPAQPLPQFIDTVFGQLLQTSYVTGPGVAERREIITLRGPVAMSKREFFATVQTALQEYGLCIQVDGGTVRIMEDPSLQKAASDIVRSRSMPENSMDSRPVTQLIELSAVDVNSMMTLLDDTYQRRGSVSFTPRPDVNTLVVKGNMTDVAAAVQLVSTLDKPRFSDGQIARIKPVFWNAEQFASAISDAMHAEGYRISAAPQSEASSFVILPVPLLNEIMVFSNDPAAYDRAIYWARELDKPTAIAGGEGVFVYEVENMPAAELARMIDSRSSPDPRGSLSEGAASRRPSLQRPNSALGGAGGATYAGDISVDTGGNRIIYRGSAAEFGQMQRLMSELDRPTPQVLIELTIAEVTLNDETRFGVEWLLQQRIGGASLKIDTRGGSKSEGGGLGATYSRAYPSGSVQAALNAIASNRNLNILSTPRLLTRSGGEAQILVGTDVPIITSQRASGSQTSGDTDILQSVQYRQTGVILNVRPVVYGDGRVDVEIFQEVSSQQPNDTSTINSPLILNRSVSTQLSLTEGSTGVIGGLIQDSFSRSQTGVPLLKDVPLLGAGFRSDGVSNSKVELLILVTPHIVRDEQEMSALAGEYSGSLNRLLRRRGSQTYTLLPWRTPLSIRRVHGPEAVAPLEKTPAVNSAPTKAPTNTVSRVTSNKKAPVKSVSKHARKKHRHARRLAARKTNK